MFSVNSMDLGTIDQFRHDMLLNSSVDPLFGGTDRTFFPAYVELPYPLHEPLKTTEYDNVKHLLKEKEDYRLLLESKKKRYKIDKKDIVEQKIGNHQYMYLPRHMFKMYQKKDPDPHFNCDYNSYYTGGILDRLEIDSKDYLLRCDSENNLLLHDLHKSQDIKIANRNSVSPIFCINSIKETDHAVLLLREKNALSAVRLIGTTKINKLFTHKYDVPILDAKLNQSNPTHLGVIYCNGKLSIRSVETGTTILSFKNDNSLNDNFQQFQFVGHDNVILADRFVVKVLDCRTKSEEMRFDPHLINCNGLCTFRVSDNDLFVASRHYIMKTDLRYLKDFSYYPHTLRAPPCYMDLTMRDDDTFLGLANQDHDKVLFTGKSPCTLPFIVPSVQDTLRECRLRNSSLVLMDHLEKRFSHSLTGLKVVNLDNEVYIYSSNCIGEIFRQKVLDEEPDVEKPVETLLTFIDKLEKPTPVLYLSLVEEMSRARFCLNTTTNKSNLERYKSKSLSKEFLKAVRPRYAKHNVLSDMAKDFLSVWEDSDEEEEEDGIVPDVPSIDRVNAWIDAQDFIDDDEAVDIPNFTE